MKIRLSQKQIRFRIDHEEVTQLWEQQKISCLFDTAILKIKFVVQISMDDEFKFEKHKDGNTIVFHVPKNQFQKLAENLPSKEGIVFSIPDEDQKFISLEVDLKKKE